MTRRVRVMIVDDHELLRRSLVDLLGAVPDLDVVAVCADGQEAVDAVEQARPDVILMDLTMPVLDGVQATELIMRCRPGQRILILTATPGSVNAARALAAGASRIVPKNVDPAALLRLLRA